MPRRCFGHDAKLAKLRSELPVLSSFTYLNTGTSGPLPSKVTETMEGALRAQSLGPRTGREYFDLLDETKQECRQALSSMLGCKPHEVALTRNTTEGLNMVTLGMNWNAGDEAVTTNVEHPGVLLPLAVARERYGVTLRIADVSSPGSDPLEAIARHITGRTRLVAISHVSYSTGAVLPVAEVAAVAHDKDAMVLVDGAQSFGAIDVDVRSLGVDFYAVPGQKWLCGPEGTGALFASRDAWSRVRVTFAGYDTVEDYDDYGGMLARVDARRFEHGTRGLPELSGQLAACRWHLEEVGISWARTRAESLAGLARKMLSDIEGVLVVTPDEHAGLVSCTTGAVDPESLAAELARSKVLVRSVRRSLERPALLRLSTAFFNTAEEVELAVSLVAEAMAREGKGRGPGGTP